MGPAAVALGLRGGVASHAGVRSELTYVAITMSIVLFALLFFALGIILGRLDIAKLRVPWEVQYRGEWVLALVGCGALYFWAIYYPLSLLLKGRHEPRQDPPKTGHRRSSWPLAYPNKLQLQ